MASGGLGKHEGRPRDPKEIQDASLCTWVFLYLVCLAGACGEQEVSVLQKNAQSLPFSLSTPMEHPWGTQKCGSSRHSIKSNYNVAWWSAKYVPDTEGGAVSQGGEESCAQKPGLWVLLLCTYTLLSRKGEEQRKWVNKMLSGLASVNAETHCRILQVHS